MGKEKSYNIKIAVFFVIFVFFLIAISLLVRFFVLYQQSKFDYSHRFSFAVNTGPKTATIFSFAPDTKSMEELDIKGISNIQIIGKTMHIPIDAVLISNSPHPFETQSVSSRVQEVLTNYRNYHGNATFIDLLKLSFFSKSVPLRSTTVDSLELPKNEEDIDKTVNSLFVDETLSQENTTIAIVNASDIPGLGSRLAKTLSNCGMNVISVSTAQQSQKKSTVTTFISPNYTVKKLEKIMNVELSDKSKPQDSAQSDNNRLSDIIIVIGQDSAQNNQF